MLISTKGRYALRVMIDLAEHRSGEFISLKEIAQRQEISEKYLESIIRMLVKAKAVESLRGKGGGYRLTKKPEQYTVGSILRLTEESLAPVSCLEENAGTCSRSGKCRTLALWQGLDKVIQEKDLDVVPKTFDTLIAAFDTVNSSIMYTNKAFQGGAAARKVLEYDLSDKAAADRAAVVESLNAGMSLEEAAAEFISEEAFDQWFTGFERKLQEAVESK